MRSPFPVDPALPNVTTAAGVTAATAAATTTATASVTAATTAHAAAVPAHLDTAALVAREGCTERRVQHRAGGNSGGLCGRPASELPSFTEPRRVSRGPSRARPWCPRPVASEADPVWPHLCLLPSVRPVPWSWAPVLRAWCLAQARRPGTDVHAGRLAALRSGPASGGGKRWEPGRAKGCLFGTPGPTHRVTLGKRLNPRGSVCL